MITLPPLSPSTLPSLKLCRNQQSFAFSTLLPDSRPLNTSSITRSHQRRRLKNGTCRAELGGDAPFAAAIGACILNSLVFPVTGVGAEDESDSVMDSTDARFAVMGIVSFIPYFNWLSWVFAWLDTGRRRYVVYAIVYLAPYIRFAPVIMARSNLSLSPEESWLPIASIVLCIVHIQLEASIRNGDFQGFQIFGEAARQLSSTTRKREHSSGHQEKGREKDHMNLPSAEEESGNEIRRWRVPKKPMDDHENPNGDRDDDHRKRD